MNPVLMNKEKCLLLVVDVQEKLAASITDIDAVVAAVKCMVDAANLLRVPVCVTEHFPARIGSTLACLRESLSEARTLEKVHFSAAAEDRFQAFLHELQPRQIIVCGTEAHVCVLQTVLALRLQGYDTFLVTDASSSRRTADRDAAFMRVSQQGVSLVSSEMVLFEWMKRADIPEFRDVLALVKSRP